MEQAGKWKIVSSARIIERGRAILSKSGQIACRPQRPETPKLTVLGIDMPPVWTETIAILASSSLCSRGKRKLFMPGMSTFESYLYLFTLLLLNLKLHHRSSQVIPTHDTFARSCKNPSTLTTIWLTDRPVLARPCRKSTMSPAW